MVGVFLIFGQVGVSIALLQSIPPSWLYTLLMWALSGAIAFGWAVALNKSGRWLLLIVPLVLVPVFGFPVMFNWMFQSKLLEAGYAWPNWARQVFAVAGGIVSVSVGFSLVIRYVGITQRMAAVDRAEIVMAARVHDALVRPVRYKNHGLEVVGVSSPSSDMGGDLIDLVERTDGIDLFLADVSGHGVQAGVIMAMLKSSLRTSLLSRSSLYEVVSDANRILLENTQPGKFATAACLRINHLDPTTVVAIVCGHPPLFIIRASGRRQRIQSQRLPLGILEEESPEGLTQEVFVLTPGDTITIYSDGLIEAADSSGRQFGIDRLEDTLAGSAGEPLEGMVQRILAQVREHGPMSDDQSLLLIRRINTEL
jgi:serine phosphatase RsbU (regulator of sigma subunit)